MASPAEEACIEALKPLLDYEGMKANNKGDCTCITWSRDQQRLYETGQCPHQVARAALSALDEERKNTTEQTYSVALFANGTLSGNFETKEKAEEFCTRFPLCKPFEITLRVPTPEPELSVEEQWETAAAELIEGARCTSWLDGSRGMLVSTERFDAFQKFRSKMRSLARKDAS